MASASLVSGQTLRTLLSFSNTNGANPQAGLTLGNDGNFYGTTSQGGISGWGTLFKMTTNGILSTLVNFDYNSTNGAYPTATLTLGNAGNFYGTTQGGGSRGLGTVFKVTTNGTLTTLVSFAGTNGAYPAAALTPGTDGNFYGTTADSGALGGGYGFGTVFKVTTNGTLTKLASFTSDYETGTSTALTPNNDGNYYGTAGDYGGNYGKVFKVTTNGTITTLFSFDYATNYNDGLYPQAPLTLGNDGNFYGTTTEGGSGGRGTVFTVTPNGTLTTLVAFPYTNGFVDPQAALTLGNDGNFYGTTHGGGSGGKGMVFMVTTNGTLITLFSFSNTNGANPQAALTFGNDGNFYGTTSRGGNTNSTYPNGMGTVFCLLLPPVIIVQPQSQTNNAGATVTFLVNATSLHSLGYQWLKNGTNLFDGGNLSGVNINALTITGISDSDAASYSIIVSNANGSVTNYATLTVIDPPIITTQPTNLLVLPGTNVAFGVSLTGTAPFRYQWRFNGTNPPDATNAIYTIPSVATNKGGIYSVVVTNAAGSDTSSNAALAVVVSPKSRTNYASSTATFNATAFSPGLLNYQWQKNATNLIDGGNLSGAANSTLTIANVSDADAAIYRAVVSDPYSSVVTSNAVLTVNNFPFIATQPHSQTVVAGSAATFNVTAYGAPPFVFQWYFKGTPVGSPTTGTNYSSFTLTNVGTNQAGNYSVRVVNGYSSVTSSSALLTVMLPPRLALQLSAGYPLLNLYGILSSNFVVQYNTNLVDTNWIILLSLTNLSSSPYQFLDPAGVSQPARFYRAFMQ